MKPIKCHLIVRIVLCFEVKLIWNRIISSKITSWNTLCYFIFVLQEAEGGETSEETAEVKKVAVSSKKKKKKKKNQ